MSESTGFFCEWVGINGQNGMCGETDPSEFKKTGGNDPMYRRRCTKHRKLAKDIYMAREHKSKTDSHKIPQDALWAMRNSWIRKAARIISEPAYQQWLYTRM